VLAGLPAGVRVLHLTGITPALSPVAAETTITAVRRARELGTAVCLDINHRSRLWSTDAARAALTTLAGLADIVIGSEDELPLVTNSPTTDPGTIAAELLAGGVAEVVVKRGGDGARLLTPAGEWSLPARPVVAVDPVGAGDAFVAGYLSGWLDGLDPAERLDRAVVTGAFAVATAGDWEGLPTREELTLLDGRAGVTLR
jgi:2-dehydro-3-deoxygluconokinase